MQRCLVVCIAACGGAEERPATTPIEITRADLKPSSDGPPSISARLHHRLRIRGTTLVVPDDQVKLAVQLSGHVLVGVFKYCVDDTGHVTTVEMLQRPELRRPPGQYDPRLGISPLVLDGKAMAVCSAATFIFEIR